MNIDFGIGAEFVSDTAAHTGRFRAIYFKETTVVAAITADNYTGNALAGESFPPRTVIHGVFTSITLTSGACIAYKI